MTPCRRHGALLLFGLLALVLAPGACPGGGKLSGKLFLPLKAKEVKVLLVNENGADKRETISKGVDEYEVTYAVTGLPGPGPVSATYTVEYYSDDARNGEPVFAEPVVVQGLHPTSEHVIYVQFKVGVRGQTPTSAAFAQTSRVSVQALQTYLAASRAGGPAANRPGNELEDALRQALASRAGGPAANRPVPPWALGAADWLTDAALKLSASPKAAEVDFTEFNNLVTLVKDMRAAVASAPPGPPDSSVPPPPSFAAAPRNPIGEANEFPRMLATLGGEGKLSLFDIKGTDLRPRDVQLPRIKDLEDADGYSRLAFAGPSHLVISNARSKRLHVIDLGDPKPQAHEVSLTGGKRPLAVAPDGKTAVVSGPGGADLQLVKVAGGQITGLLPSGPIAVLCARFSPDGKWLASGTATGLLQVWDLASGKATCTKQLNSKFINALEFARNGRRLVVGTGLGGEGGLTLMDLSDLGWQLEEQKSFPQLKGGVLDLVVSDNGNKLGAMIAGGSKSILFDARGGRLQDPREAPQAGKPLFLDDFHPPIVIKFDDGKPAVKSFER
jgi:hypothetical protein